MDVDEVSPPNLGFGATAVNEPSKDVRSLGLQFTEPLSKLVASGYPPCLVQELVLLGREAYP